MAVRLGYKNVYRDPLGYPAWQEHGLPVARAPREVMETTPAPVGPFLSWSMLWTLFGVFVGGMALNLTPCVYPLIPITVSYFSGLSGGSRSRLMAHGLFYLGGLAVTNTALGVTAALTGGLMGAMLQNPVVLAGSGGHTADFCRQLVRLLGAAPAPKSDPGGNQVLCRVFRHLVHGSDPGSGGGTLHRPVCFRSAHLGGQPGIGLAGVRRVFHS